MSRDDEEYQSFVVARYRTLVRSGVLLGCSLPDAEDAAQEALLACYRSWPRVSAASEPDAYVYRVLVNRISRSRRRRWRGEVPHGELPEFASSGDLAGDVTVSHTVRAALRRLANDQRHVVVLRYFADLTEAQIADALGIAPGTVKSRAARAMAALSQDASLGDLVHTTREENR